jgi:DNA-binding MarR family transcriptional regulator
MSGPTDEQIIRVGAALDAFTRRHKLADVSGSELPLNELDKQVLLFVANNPGCGPSDVARFLAVANTTISSATDRLVKRALLDRDRIEGDRRAISLRLSGLGETTVAALHKVHQGLLRMMLQRLSITEREQFITLITKIVYDDS